MDPVAVIEVLDRARRVTDRVAIDATPVTVGRAYANDVVLDDPFVSPEHLRVHCDEDGRLVVEDLDSLNGLYELSPPRRVSRVLVESECHVRIGETVLRLRAATYRAEPTLPAASEGGIARVAGRWTGAIVLGFALFLAVDGWLGSYDADSRKLAVLGSLTLVVAGLAWSGVWAVVSRAVSHRFHFREHCTVAAGALLGLDLLQKGIDYYAFAFAADASAGALRWGSWAAVLAGVLYCHGRLCSTETPRRLAVRALVATAAIGGVFAVLTHVTDGDFTARLDLPRELKPVAFRLTRGRPVDEFLAGAADLRDRVDALVTRTADEARP